MTPIRRLINPSVLALVLLCFALPFAAVSCETPEGSISAEYTGWDMVVGGKPDVVTSSPDDKLPKSDQLKSIRAQPLADLTTLLIICGLVTTPARIRSMAKVAITGSATLLLIVSQVAVHDGLTKMLSESSKFAAPSNMVESRVGFWVALLLLLGLTAHNVLEMRREPRADHPGIEHPTAS